jgi:zinc transport system permease protein
MLEIFTYSFMQRAFIAGLTVGVVAPLIGTFLMAKRYSLIADSLAHVALAGVAVGVLTGLSPMLGALAMAVIAALLVERLRAGRRLTGDVALAMLLSSGLALTVVLLGLARNVHVDLFAYLFGSITTVQTPDLWVIVPLALGVIAVIALLYKEWTYLAFDDESARVSGLPVRLMNQLLVILAAFTVVAALRIVGALLIGALMVIPVAAALQVSRSLAQTVWVAIAFGIAAVTIGLFAAFYLNLAAGGAIVLVALALFLLAALWRSLAQR